MGSQYTLNKIHLSRSQTPYCISRSSLSWPLRQLQPHFPLESLTRSAPVTLAPLLFLENVEPLPPMVFSLAVPSASTFFPQTYAWLTPSSHFGLRLAVTFFALPWNCMITLYPPSWLTFSSQHFWLTSYTHLFAVSPSLDCKFCNSRDFVHFGYFRIPSVKNSYWQIASTQINTY